MSDFALIFSEENVTSVKLQNKEILVFAKGSFYIK